MNFKTEFWCSLLVLASLFAITNQQVNGAEKKNVKAAAPKVAAPKTATPEPAEEQKPIKNIVIAPDLTVEALEGGIFPHSHTPADGADKITFMPTNVSRFPIYLYGYRMKLKTTRKEVKVREQVEGTSIKCVDRVEKPVNGYIFKAWEDEKLRKDGYSVKVWVDDVELPTMKVRVN